eukprot:6799914-Prymnesium_polylepis.1
MLEGCYVRRDRELSVRKEPRECVRKRGLALHAGADCLQTHEAHCLIEQLPCVRLLCGATQCNLAGENWRHHSGLIDAAHGVPSALAARADAA